MLERMLELKLNYLSTMTWPPDITVEGLQQANADGVGLHIYISEDDETEHFNVVGEWSDDDETPITLGSFGYYNAAVGGTRALIHYINEKYPNIGIKFDDVSDDEQTSFTLQSYTVEANGKEELHRLLD